MVERLLVSLTDAERTVLLDHVKLRPRLRSTVQSAQNGDRGWGITPSADDAEEIRDCCGSTLAAIGFDESVPTEDGLLLQSMIDKLFAG